jgi:RHS repeat-associated protein
MNRQHHVFHTDALGSIVAISDASGAAIQDYAYSAFGEIRAQSGSDMNRITYTAREALGDSLGFYYYRNRILDPASGRFISEDPLAFIDGPNLYQYVKNNPIKRPDPLGLVSWGTVWTTCSEIAGGIWLLKLMNDMRKENNKEREELDEINNSEDLEDWEKFIKRRELVAKSISGGSMSKAKDVVKSTTDLLNPLPCP